MARGRSDPEVPPPGHDELLARVAISAASPAMRRFTGLLSQAARHDAPVLLLGEVGSGKSTFGRALHALSPRAARPLVRVDCPVVTGDLSAPARLARGGTLFLDEVAELASTAQSAALRLLQAPGPPLCRIVASTRHDLDRETRAGAFRKDLFYRLDVLELRIPPLRERPEDVLPLARGLLAELARLERCAPPELTPALELALLRHSWPGNVQELRSTLQRMLILSPGDRLDVSALPARIPG